ncbi:unnamed protein product [Allacma fusca]|uniref:Peptidase S1 domain-containing protein n=1 Tax=Allacma fusca TaxID=39272 RepID=A0A8J2P3E1_9HEXA|nr:unnamed protein product [Allacma fusca]
MKLRVSLDTAVPSRIALLKKSTEFVYDRGMYASMLRVLEESLNFTSEPFPSTGGGGTGTFLKNGTWNGLVGDVYTGKADLGCCAGQTWLRNQYVEIAQTHETMVISFTTGNRPPSYNWKAIFGPFQLQVWLLVISSFVLGFVTVWILNNRGLNKIQGGSKVMDTFVILDFMVSAFFEKVSNFRKNLNIRGFCTFWSLIGLVVSTAYKGKIVGQLAFPSYPVAPKNFLQLIQSDNVWALQFYGGVSYDLIRFSPSQTIGYLSSKMGLEPDAQKCFSKTRTSKFACIAIATMAEYALLKNFSHVKRDFTIAASREFSISVGPVLPKQSYLLETFRWAVGATVVSGLTDQWIRMDYENVRLGKLRDLKIDPEEDMYIADVVNNTLTLKNLKGAFFILFIGRICPGFCVPQELCFIDGGQVLGLCVNGRVCCDVSHKLNRSTCGTVVNSWGRDKPVQFVSPLYPGLSSGSLICQFELKLDKNIVGVRVDLDKFELQSNPVVHGDGRQDHQCDADMFFIKGFSDWMTNPICGRLNGFSILIDTDIKEYGERKLMLLFIMSSKEYRWKVKIHQISLNKLKKSEICLRTRLSKLAKVGNFSTTMALSKPTDFIKLREEEAYQRWKWDVDIVTRAKPAYKAPCYKSQNNSEEFSFLHKLCTGTILDERHVLTTANCFSKSQPHSIQDLAILTAAFCPVDSRNPGDHYFSVESVTLHFNYISSIMHNDLAILRTRKPIKFGELVRPISIFGAGNSRLFAFSPKKPFQETFPTVPEALLVTPMNASDCSTAQTLHINLTPALLKEYTMSNKYKNLMTNWICFPGHLSPNYFICPTDFSSLEGASLIGLIEEGEVSRIHLGLDWSKGHKMKFLQIALVFGFSANFVLVQGIPPLQILDDRLNQLSEAPASVFIDPRFQLPTNVVPYKYKLFIRPILYDDPSGDVFTAPGNVTITLKCQEATNLISLHAVSATVAIPENTNSVRVRKVETEVDLSISGFNKDIEKGLFTIQLDASLEKDSDYEIFIPFTTTISQTDLNGLYLSYYDDPETKERRHLATTQFQPSSARKAFPCFDEPALKAIFEISVGRHITFQEALSNMNLATTTVDPNLPDWRWDNFHPSPVKMSTYLVAFIVSDFKSVEAKENLDGKPVKVYGPGYLIDQNGGDFAAEASSRIIHYYQDFVKVPYSLPKLDSIAIPQFSAGAMENWGLNTYRTEYLIHIPGENTETERKKITQVLSHEITHQWYGNLVTCKTWDYTWLNEGFARFLQYRGMNAGTPEFDTLVAIISDATQLAMPFDHGSSTHPMVKEVTTPEEASNIFSRITYEKAASILRMVENVLTTQIFDDSIRDYLQKMTENSAVQTDLFDSFQKLAELNKSKLPAGERIHNILETWTSQSGYPLVRVSGSGNNKLYLHQEKFLLNQGSKATNAEEGYWYIPVKIVGAGNPDFSDKTPTLWIPNNVSTMAFTDPSIDTKQWLIVNPDVTGYYRVLYDTNLRNRIREQLETNPEVISPGTRSQLIDDYFNFAFAGYTPMEAALDLTSFLHQETNLVVWVPVLTHLRPIFTKFSAEETAFAVFKEYFASKINGALDLIGWEQTGTEKGVKVILRAQLLDFACGLDQTKCVDYSKKLFQDWQANPSDRSIIVPDIRPVVFCSAVASGDQGVWNQAYALYRTETFAATKSQLFKSLACSKNLATLWMFLQKAVDNEGGLDVVAVAQAIAANSVGRQITYTWLKNEFSPSGPIGPSQFASVVTTLSTYWNKQSQYDDLNNFIDLHGITGSPRTSLNTSLAKIQDNIEWFNKFGSSIVSWLQVRSQSP